jgi:putative oxidoreductase
MADHAGEAETGGGAVGSLVDILKGLPVSVAQLVLRVTIGWVFFRSGLSKAENMDNAVFLFSDIHPVPLLSPEMAAYLSTFFELAMPVFLFVGLATRFAAIPLMGMALMIHLVVFPVWNNPGNWVEFGTWFGVFWLLISAGGGRISLDHLIAKRV